MFGIMIKMNAKRPAAGVYFRIFVCIFIFSCAAPLFSGGKRDPVLEKADSLVEEKRWLEAIQLLSQFIANDNERFDEAEQRIYNILRHNNSYYGLLNELINIVENSPENVDKIVALSETLKTMNVTPTEETSRFINQVVQTAQLVRNRRLMEDILRQGRELLDKRQYLAALEKYKSGFTLYQTEMRDANFGDDIAGRTGAYLNAIDAAISTITAVLAPINNTITTLGSIDNNVDTPQNRLAVANTLSAVEPALNRLIEAKTAFAGADVFLESTGARPEITESSNTGRYFFPFASLFIRGRPNESIREGMLGTVDAIWESIMLPLDNAYLITSERLYTVAETNTENGNYSIATRAVSETRDFIKGPLFLADKSQTFTDIDINYPVSGYNQNITELVDSNVLRFRAMNDALHYFDDAISIGTSYTGFQQGSQTVNVIEQLRENKTTIEAAFVQARAFRSAYRETSTKIDNNIIAINNSMEQFASRAESARRTEDAAPIQAGLRYFGDARRIFEKLGIALFGDEEATALELYALANTGLTEKIAKQEKLLNDIAPLMEGIPIITEHGTEVTARYPREASREFIKIENDLRSDLQFSNTVLNEYGKDPPHFQNNPEYHELENATIVFAERLRVLNENETNNLERVLENYGRAESLRRDGERLLEESQTALGRENFTLARENLEGTQTRFTASLDLQENPALRRTWANVLEPLAVEIARAEYEAVVKEVRGLINTARDRYFAGTFDRAEEGLMRAENRWARVRPDPHEEVEYWLSLVRGALTLRAGTTIPVTAPLYPEMSQLLNDARKNYSDGVSLLRSSRREEGLMKFEYAREKTREVRLVFPVNQEAGILELRIEQVIDPDAFDENFRRRFVAAVAGSRRGSMESYIELENLSNINPRYTGMQTAITEAQYDVGLKMRPIARNIGVEATEIARRAESIMRGNVSSRYEEILALANRALELDPTNTVAAQVKDSVQIAINNRSAAATLASDAAGEQEYLRALREYTQGNNILAMSIVQRLLQNPAYRDNVRFNELRRRIASTM
jgi:hypothetical protein